MISEGKAIQVAIDQIRGYLYPTEAEQAAAYELLIELSTRAAGVQTTSTASTVRDTLTSIHDVFGLTRSILRKHGADASKGSGGNISLAVIAVRVLNEVFRPVLSKWHPILTEYESHREQEAPCLSEGEWELRWPQATQCRAELAEMRGSIRSYIDTLSRIAGAAAVADAVLRAPSSQIFAQVRDKANKQPSSDKPEKSSWWTLRHNRLPYRDEMARWLDLREVWQMFRATLRAKHPPGSAGRQLPDGSLKPVAEFTAKQGEDFWFDYIADMGDGFDGTAPVAWLSGRKHISIPDDRSGELPSPPAYMPRGDLLVLGGDEVYTYASAEAYQRQTVLPFRMGLEDSSGSSPATVVAIPGNHDWMGGIEHFEQVFVNQTATEKSGDGGVEQPKLFAEHWKVEQPRLYWSVKLPQGWWLWGIDTGLHNEWPDEQVAYFTKAAARLRPGDRVVLCTPVPLWQLRQKFPDDYTKLRSKLDPLITEAGVRMPLCLSGDTHMFAHFQRIDCEQIEEHVTAGGGGAFLQPTHNLPERIPLEHGNAEFKITSRWPLPADSRALAADARILSDSKNWPLIGLVAGLHAAFFGLLALPRPWSWDAASERWAETAALDWATRSPWGWLLLAVIIAAGVVSVKGNSLEPNLTTAGRVYGLIIGIGMAATFVVSATLLGYLDPWRQEGHTLPEPPPSPPPPPDLPRPIMPPIDGGWWHLLCFLAAMIVGAVLTMTVFLSLSKWVNSRIKASDTVAFSTGPSTRFKHFVRCRIDRSGDLTLYVVGIDPVGKGWYDAMTKEGIVPPYDPQGIPRIHYVWGKTYNKFVPHPIELAISISDNKESDPKPNQQSVFHEAATRLIKGGHTLMYGGRPGEGYTEQLREIEVERHADNPNAEHHLVNYVADYLVPRVRSAEAERVGPALLKTIEVARRRADGESSVEREIRDLTALRERMTDDADARLVIGGDLQPSDPGRRIAPGVIEEAYLAMQARQPLVIVGGFGGAAGLLAKALLNDLDPVELDQLAKHFHPPFANPDGSSGVGFAEMVQSFNSVGLLRNGLTDGENRELLRTGDATSAVRLIWRSVDRIGSHHVR